MKILYFAWVRERDRQGGGGARLRRPASRRSDDLIAWLARRGEEYAYAFENPRVIRAAIDRTHVRPETAHRRRRRDRLLPPMTGGSHVPAKPNGFADKNMRHSATSNHAAHDRPPAARGFRRRRRSRGADARTHATSARSSPSPASAAATEDGEPIAALTLEHYPGMAEAEIARHVAEAERRWTLLGVTVIHRYGRLRRARTSCSSSPRRRIARTRSRPPSS